MSLHIHITRYSSQDGMQLRALEAPVFARACPIGEDPQAFALVRAGDLEISYSPLYRHYYFSRAPQEEWFTRYYADAWMSRHAAAPESAFARAKKKLRAYAGAGWRHARKLSGYRYSFDDRVADADIQRYHLLLLPYLSKDAQVLKIGTGTGDFLVPYLKKGFRCAGIEPSSANASVARLRGVQMLHSVIADTPDIRRMIAPSSVVFSNHSLEHHFDPNRLLRLCSEEMREGTILSITVPNADAGFLFHDHLFFLHLDMYTPHSLEALLNKYQFDVLLREIGVQLRYVAIKRKPAAPADMRSEPFDKQAFTRHYAQRCIRQLTGGDSGDGQNFSVAYVGARPFTTFSYDLYYGNSAPPKVRRRVEGAVRAGDNAQAVAVQYQFDQHHTMALLK